MRILLLFVLLLPVMVARTQTCSCTEEFRFVKTFMERNHAGFNKKIRSAAEPAYAAFTAALEDAIKKETDSRYCIAYLKRYILYLQDHHSNITPASSSVVDEKDPAALAAFLASVDNRQTETLSLDTAALLASWRKQPPQAPEGIYYTADSTYVVALVRHESKRHDYAAVILQSKTRLWLPGQVKFELKKMNDSLFAWYTAYRNHRINYEEVPARNGIPELSGWTRAIPGSTSSATALSAEKVSFKVIDSLTTLLSIRSFNAGLTRMLDSVYQSILPEIKKYPKLIIDVRDNGGGSDASYKSLMPLLYTDPFNSDVMEYFVTPDNIRAYAAYDSALLRQDPKSRPPFREPLALMRNAKPYTYTHFGNGKPRSIRYTVNKGNPQKIAVVYNRNCASSCESFLFEVLNSRKTIRVGENSGGYTGYGNVMTITTPCGNTLAWTTTVYREQWKYEFAGIPPQYRVPSSEPDWIRYASQVLDKN